MRNYTEKQIEIINEQFKKIATDDSGKMVVEYIECYGSEENITLEDKVNELWMYYDAAGFDIKTDEDFCRFFKL